MSNRPKEWPKIKSRQTTRISPWIELIAREVEFAPGEPPQTYHAIGQQDYIAIVARTPDGRFPIIRQYRPALEMVTVEFPAGLVEPGEGAAEGCRRELLEETGFPARTVHALGTPIAACSGRLSNRIHSFFVETGERVANFTAEPGLSVELVSDAELVRLIHSGDFIQQLHLGALLLAELKGLLKLPR